jgi:hypothetical protein
MRSIGIKGFAGNLIQSRAGQNNERLYSIRMSRKVRVVVRRSGEFVEFLMLHADHDSACR